MQETLGPARDALIGLAHYLEAAKWALVLLTLGGIAVMLWARIDDRRRAGRTAERVERMTRTIEVQRDQSEAAARRLRDGAF